MALLRILATTCVFFGIIILGGEIFAPDLYKGTFFREAFLLIVGGVLLEVIDKMVKSLIGIHKELKKLMVCILFILFGSQASAWVSKEFIPSNVSLITVDIHDQANDGCWTNIGEVKRYAEDKLVLAGFEVFRGGVEDFLNDGNSFILRIRVNAARRGGLCYGDIEYGIATLAQFNNIVGIFLVAESNNTISDAKNVNKYTLDRIGIFMKEIENPQWDPTQ